MEERLHKFARIVEAGSFTAAAASLHISQPALTTAVKKLERELKAELLIRGSRSFELTTAGHIAYQSAQALRLQTDNLRLQVAEAASQRINLRLGMIDSIAHLLFVHGDNLHQLEQGTQLSLTVDNSARLIEYLGHDTLDLVLSAKQPRPPAGLQQTDLGAEPLVLVAPASQAGQVRHGISRGTVAHFLAYNQNSHTHQIVQRHFARHHIAVSARFYSTSPEIMLQLVLAGQGAAVLPYLLAQPFIASGDIAPVSVGNEPYIARPIVVAQRTGRLLPQQATELLATARRELEQLRATAHQLFN